MADLIDVTGMGDAEVRALITPEMLAKGERIMAELRRVMDSRAERTCHYVYDKEICAWRCSECEAESGHESGQNRDSVQIESPTVQKAPECDREALLALADEMDEIGREHDAGMRMIGGHTMEALARRIREALGVSDD